MVAHISKLKSGEVIEQPVYSFVTHNRTKDVIKTHPRKVIIVEGILILTNQLQILGYYILNTFPFLQNFG